MSVTRLESEGIADVEGGYAEQTLGLRDAVVVLASPRSVFARVEDTGAYGWALVILLGLVVLIGYTKVQTGLIDREVDKRTADTKARIEKQQGGLVDRARLRTQLEDADAMGKFMKLTMRLGVIVASPVYFLASFLLIASALYAAVALTGRKPEYHTLMSICVYAGFVELVGYIVGLAMMLHYRTLEVDTSLAALGQAGVPTPLSAVDPFRIWFWVLVAIGLVVTRQLSRRAAILSCSVMGLVAMGVRAGLAYVPTG